MLGDHRAKYRPYRVSFPPPSQVRPFEVHSVGLTNWSQLLIPVLFWMIFSPIAPSATIRTVDTTDEGWPTACHRRGHDDSREMFTAGCAQLRGRALGVDLN